jgi:hypothetical protein
MLEAGEVAVGTMRGWVPNSASSCELEVLLTPQSTTAVATPTSLGKHCVGRSGSKPC